MWRWTVPLIYQIGPFNRLGYWPSYFRRSPLTICQDGWPGNLHSQNVQPIVGLLRNKYCGRGWCVEPLSIDDQGSAFDAAEPGLSFVTGTKLGTRRKPYTLDDPVAFVRGIRRCRSRRASLGLASCWQQAELF